jgi:hypothetical protein
LGVKMVVAHTIYLPVRHGIRLVPDLDFMLVPIPDLTVLDPDWFSPVPGPDSTLFTRQTK